ncbi:response regulator [Ottowia thiooxydans]|uniref:Two-component system cell cycle response regulator CpdR n=1 Tax=Ottowia thiooxydans TaxID=219182 RepID=A0ABV2QCV3_9BURK
MLRKFITLSQFPRLGVNEPQSMISYLYVEDDEDIREVVASFMEAEHRKIVSVPHAEAALAAADDQEFDVLITDISLPGMSGTDLARHWLQPNKDRFILLLSGYEMNSGLESIGPNVTALLKSSEPEELEKKLLGLERAMLQSSP